MIGSNIIRKGLISCFKCHYFRKIVNDLIPFISIYIFCWTYLLSLPLLRKSWSFFLNFNIISTLQENHSNEGKCLNNPAGTTGGSSGDVGEDSLILQSLHRFTYVTAHSTTLPPLHLRRSSLYNPSVASPTSQSLLLRHLASRPWQVQNRSDR